ncbi:hypothetical protein [Spiroplasma endosymbiont of Aspidapion aeneum]|uniref:hypothetical protein n=1 Tax=Spiroplasma endosymbiont of Aspidapion aeneum TaxID=3066276 RepID=UPI00313CBA5A
MGSIIKKIQKISESSDNPIYNQIALKIMDFLIAKKKVPSEKEIAKMCYCSLSTITNFSKKVGVSGYRELTFRVIIESEDAIEQINGKAIKYDDNEEAVINWNIFRLIKKNIPFIKMLVDEIIIENKLNILSSFQGFQASKFLRDNLENLDINCNVYTSQDYFQQSKIIKHNLFLIVLTGWDNDSFEQYILKNLSKENGKKIFAITTTAQLEKFNDWVSVQKFVIENEKIDRSNITRHVVLTNIFYEIYSAILAKLSKK